MSIDFNDPEIQAAIKAQVDKEVEGLKNKNSELLAKVANGKATAEELEKAQAALKEIEDAKLKDAEQWGELENRLRSELSETKASLEKERDSLVNTLKERDLMAALVAANVAPVYLEAAKALMMGQIEYKDGKAVAGDKDVAEFVKEWADTDTGKAFVQAPKNSGGNAPGSNGTAPKGRKFDEMTDMEKVALRKNDPEAYEKAKAEFYAR